MSLRDQLLAKGVVSKKKAREVNRELRQERKQKQGQRRKKNVVAREEQAAVKAAMQAELDARRAARQARDAEKATRARELQLRQLVAGNIVRGGGPVPFHFREGSRVGRMQVSDRIAWKLRAGELGICRLVSPWGEPEEVIVRARAAQRLLELGASDRVLFFQPDPSGISAPELMLPQPPGEPDLRAHRATEADLERYSASSSAR